MKKPFDKKPPRGLGKESDQPLAPKPGSSAPPVAKQERAPHSKSTEEKAVPPGMPGNQTMQLSITKGATVTAHASAAAGNTISQERK